MNMTINNTVCQKKFMFHSLAYRLTDSQYQSYYIRLQKSNSIAACCQCVNHYTYKYEFYSLIFSFLMSTASIPITSTAFCIL